jgi:hypothetical protein
VPETVEPILGEIREERDYFRGAKNHVGADALGQVHVSSVYRSTADSLSKFSLSTHVLDDDGRLLGRIGFSVTTDASMGLKVLQGDSRRAVLVAPTDPSSPIEQPLPKYVMVVHPAYAHGDKPAAFERPELVSPFDRACPRDLSPPSDHGAARVEVRQYLDPLGRIHPEFAGSHLAGLAPVGNTGFVVIVEQKADE